MITLGHQLRLNLNNTYLGGRSELLPYQPLPGTFWVQGGRRVATKLWSGSTSAATQSRRGKCVNTHVMLQVSVLDTLSVERRSLFYKLELTCDDQCRREEEGGTGAQLCCIMILSFSVVSLFSVKTFSRYDLNGGAKNLFNEARTRSLRPWRWQACAWLTFKKSDKIINLIQHKL